MELKEYHFTDSQIDFIMNFLRDNSHNKEYTQWERNYIQELSNQIEDQIVNHPTNDWWHSLPNRFLRLLKSIVIVS